MYMSASILVSVQSEIGLGQSEIRLGQSQIRLGQSQIGRIIFRRILDWTYSKYGRWHIHKQSHKNLCQQLKVSFLFTLSIHIQSILITCEFCRICSIIMSVGFSFLLGKTVFLFFSSFSGKIPLFSENAAPLFSSFFTKCWWDARGRLWIIV